MEKTRILIVENSIHVTGALKSVTRTAFDLKEEFDFVFVIPAKSKGRSWIEGKGFTAIYELPFREINRSIGAIARYLPALFVNAWRLKRIINQERIDVVHVNDLYNLVAIAARFFGKATPTITHVRFLPDKFPKVIFNAWMMLHLRYAVKVIAVSHFLNSKLKPHHKIVVIPNELPVEERYPAGLPGHTSPTLLYLSNVIPGKGHTLAIDAFASLSKEFPQWRLRFVGGDMGLPKNRQYKEELMRLCHSKGISDRTDWIDFTEDVEREYRMADVVLNFSESESFSITCLEALFFRSALIATESGGPAEIVDHGQTGFLIPINDHVAAVERLRELMQNPELRERFATMGGQVVRERFSVQQTSFKLKKCYRDALVS